MWTNSQQWGYSRYSILALATVRKVPRKYGNHKVKTESKSSQIQEVNQHESYTKYASSQETSASPDVLLQLFGYLTRSSVRQVTEDHAILRHGIYIYIFVNISYHTH